MQGWKHKNCYSSAFLVSCEPSYIVNTNDFKYAKFVGLLLCEMKSHRKLVSLLLLSGYPFLSIFSKTTQKSFLYAIAYNQESRSHSANQLFYLNWKKDKNEGQLRINILQGIIWRNINLKVLNHFARLLSYWTTVDYFPAVFH